MITRKSGFVMILTLMVLALVTVLVTYLFNKGSAHVAYVKAMNERERARMLALSGIEVAMAQLGQEITVEQKGSPAPAAGQQQAEGGNETILAQKLINRIVPTLNRWQTFPVTQKIDGIDGSIKICVMSEQGKIDLNQWYDFKKHDFKEGAKQLLQELLKTIKKEELFGEFEKFLKDRQYRLDDATELMKIKGFEDFRSRLFYVPPMEKEKEGSMLPVYLTDIFTVWSGKQTLDPWLLSDSVCALLGLQRVQPDDGAARAKLVATAAKNSKESAQWNSDWNKLLLPLYNKDFKALPKGIELILSTKFEPCVFSVLSYGKVGAIEQRVFAILESTKQFKDNVFTFTVVIKKLYWI